MRKASPVDHRRVRAQLIFGNGLPRIEIYGSAGTLQYLVASDRLLGASLEQDEPQDMAVPPDRERHWTVERDFIASIREGTFVGMTSFEDGVKYMEFTEAVDRARQTGRTCRVGEVG